jgi:sulfur relay (sulfurtransferase) complex TusBCD TusD component (DsrE family)
MKKVIVQISNPPYGRENTFSALYIATASVSKGIDAKVILIEDGVFTAKKGQLEPQKAINMPSVEEQIRDLLDLGARVIVERQAAEIRGIVPEELIEGTEILDLKEIQDIVIDDGELIVGY